MEQFAQYLLERKIATPADLQAVSSDASSAEPLCYRLLRHKPQLQKSIWSALADFLQIELVDPVSLRLAPDLIQTVPPRLAHEHSVVPLSLRNGALELAVADPRQLQQCEELALLFSQSLNKPAESPLVVMPRLACPGDIDAMIKALYGIGAETIQDMQPQPASQVRFLDQQVVDLTDAQASGDEAAIIQFVNQLLLEAVKNEASDIHLEPFENRLQIRYRLDGMLRVQSVPEKIKHLESAIVSRIKIMAHLDIAEKRLPQDGQIRLTVLGRPIDVRVSVLPTLYGQGLALRLLDRQVAFRQLENLGMPKDYLHLYQRILTLSHGVILVTGPTGSGKTTTLYASLHEMNSQDRKIITVEDPIEYQLQAITQIQVKPQIGLTFASILRNILRHDPDMIMVGEIRDRTTAQIAVSAAMTGHLVFSTLHTNDASSAPVRLLEMGVDSYLVSSALEAVLAQRLVRLLCRACRVPVPAEDLSYDDLSQLTSGTIYRSNGCPACRDTGYTGRTAIFEMFAMNDTIRRGILNHSDSQWIQKQAVSLGMRTLRQSGLELVKQGQTSLEEVCRVAKDESIDMKQELTDL